MAEPSPHIELDESTKVLHEYLELFHCLGYRYKYYLAPNAILQYFGSSVRGAVRIHEFFLKRFHSSLQHADFEKATSCCPIERNDYHLTTKNLPTSSTNAADLINPRNKLNGITSLKTRADSDIDSDIETFEDEIEQPVPTSSQVEQQQQQEQETELNYDSDDSVDFNSPPESKRIRYSTPPPTPFKYLRRLPTKSKPYVRKNDDISNDDSSDDEDTERKSQINKTNEYSPLRYIEAFGKIRETDAEHLESNGDCLDRSVRLRISYRRNLRNQTIQFALIIYEHQEEILNIKRIIRKLDFSKCIEDELSSSTDDPLECMDAQPAVILSNRDGEEHETIATVTTPTSAEIATALEEAAFTIQPPIQRTPTKTTPIPPGTPKRRPRSAVINMSGVVPLSVSTIKKFQRPSCRAPRLSAARNLRL